MITQRSFSEEVIIYNTTKPDLVTLNATNVLTNLTTEAKFSVGGFGSMISYQVLDQAKEVELHSENLTFENSFTIIFEPPHIGLWGRIWAVAEGAGDVNEFTIGIGTIEGIEITSHSPTMWRFSCKLIGTVHYVNLQEFPPFSAVF